MVVFVVKELWWSLAVRCT